MAVYQAMGWTPTGNVGVKLSTGEPPASHYLDPALIGDLVHEVNGTIVECNTAYGGARASTAMHRQVAEDHGFTAIADVDIQDEEGSMALPVANGFHLKENYVGSHFANYDLIWCCPISRGMPWRASAEPSRIFPSALAPARQELDPQRGNAPERPRRGSG